MFASFLATPLLVLAAASPIQDPTIQELKDRLAKVKERLQTLKPDLPIDIGELGESVSYRGDSVLVLTTSYQQHARNTDRPDGAMSATFVFGRPDRLTVDVPISFTDLSHPGKRGTIGLRFSRAIVPGLSASVGFDQFLEWGKSDTFRGMSGRLNKVIGADMPAWQEQVKPERRKPGGRRTGFESEGTLDSEWTSIEGRTSRLATPFKRVILQLGLGNGRYAPEGSLNQFNFTTGKPYRNLERWGAFGGATFFLEEQVQFFMRYAAHDWATGITIRPTNSPFYGTLAVADIFGSSAQYLWSPPGFYRLASADSPRLLVTIGYVIRF